MPEIRFIYFDLDDTLLDHRKAERLALADLCGEGHFGALPPAKVQAEYHPINVEVWRRYAAGDLTKAQAQHLRFARLLDALGKDGDPDALGARYLERYAPHWSFIDGAQAAFHTLADHFPVGILTNGFAEVQHAKLARFPDLHDRLRALVISEDIGVLKPHPRLFAHAAEAAATPPEAILYVGDSFTSDVQGGLAAGWSVAWYTENIGEPGVFAFREWPALVAHLIPEHVHR